MRRKFALFLSLIFLGLLSTKESDAQGASFSFFFPKNGEMAAPVPPVAIRGLGVKFGDHVSLSTGITWYRLTGMGVKNVPFEDKSSIMGPVDNFMIPGRLELIIPIGHTEIRVGGGAFTFFSPRLDVRKARLEEALMDHYDKTLLKGNFHHDNNWGLGWMLGATYTYYIKGKTGIRIGGNYLMGSSDLGLRGSYRSVEGKGGSVQKERFSFPDSELDHSGWEFSIGVVVKQE